MIVIVPHPTEELLLIHEQKKLISKLFTKNQIIYSHIPLWIPTDFETIDQAKNQIKKITLLAPQNNPKEKCIICPVHIETQVNIIKSALRFIECPDSLQHDLSFSEEQEIFPLNLKIFRLGECESPSPNVCELKNTVWKKL